MWFLFPTDQDKWGLLLQIWSGGVASGVLAVTVAVAIVVAVTVADIAAAVVVDS